MMKRVCLLAAIVVASAVFAGTNAVERVFFVGAHPDDSEGFAATAFLLRDKCEIHVIDLTRGENGLGKAGREDGSTAKIRVREEQDACALLGATPHFLDEVNGPSCCAGMPSVERLMALMNELKPVAIFTHWPVDTHSDHVQTAAVVSHAIRLLQWKGERYYFEVLRCQTKNYVPLYSVDVTQTISNKVAMLRKYACQNENDWLAKTKYEQAAERGAERTPPCAFAETFTTFTGAPIAGGVLERLPQTVRLSSSVGRPKP